MKKTILDLAQRELDRLLAIQARDAHKRALAAARNRKYRQNRNKTKKP